MSEKAVTFDDQVSELRRELAMRERLYPNWIERGTLTPDKANKQIATLRATLHLLEDLKDSEISLPAPLFRLRTETGLP